MSNFIVFYSYSSFWYKMIYLGKDITMKESSMLIDEETLKGILSKNIKSARTNANFTQDMLSENSNISTNFLKDIERWSFKCQFN